MSAHQKELVKQLKEMIMKGNAHAPLEKALDGLPEDKRGIAPVGLPYSVWQLAEHIRIAQKDILEFSRNASHKSPKWPDEYWPKEKAPKDAAAWHHCLKAIEQDRNEFIALLEDDNADLYTPFPHGDGQNLLREALLIGEHNSYHTAEIIVIRRLLGKWK